MQALVMREIGIETSIPDVVHAFVHFNVHHRVRQMLTCHLVEINSVVAKACIILRRAARLAR